MRQLFFAGVAFLATGILAAAEKKPILEVEQDAMLVDTQPEVLGVPADHFTVYWWIPHEFWQVSFAHDEALTDAAREQLLESMDNVSVLAVVQADIGLLGNFDFYPKEEIKRNVALSFTGADGQAQRLPLLEVVDPELQLFLDGMKPILSASMGPMGENFHFFVLSDDTETGERTLNPYEEGKITIELLTRDEERMKSELYLPLNSLFVPRKCPNGRDAHVTWKFCPWTGQPLED